MDYFSADRRAPKYGGHRQKDEYSRRGFKMSRRIAVSDALTPVKRMLSNAGYDVVNLESNADLSEKGMGDYDAVVLSGIRSAKISGNDHRLLINLHIFS